MDLNQVKLDLKWEHLHFFVKTNFGLQFKLLPHRGEAGSVVLLSRCCAAPLSWNGDRRKNPQACSICHRATHTPSMQILTLDLTTDQALLNDWVSHCFDPLSSILAGSELASRLSDFAGQLRAQD